MVLHPSPSCTRNLQVGILLHPIYKLDYPLQHFRSEPIAWEWLESRLGHNPILIYPWRPQHIVLMNVHHQCVFIVGQTLTLHSKLPYLLSYNHLFRNDYHMPSSFGTLMPLLKVGNLMHQHLGLPWPAHITRRKTCIFDCSLRLNFSRKRHFATKILLVA